MINKKDILEALDDFRSENAYEFFPNLGKEEFSLAATKMSIFCDSIRWAIVFEKIGFNESDFQIDNDSYYFGNCLINMETKYDDGEKIWSNYKSVSILKYKEIEPYLDHILYIKDNVDSILIKGKKIAVERDLNKYIQKGINIKTYKNTKNQIDFIAIMRYLVGENYDLFTLDDAQIKNYIPTDLPKLMTLRDWYHQDFDFIHFQNKYIGKKPSSYETFQLIADVISTGDTSKYQPTLQPNTNWVNWNKQTENKNF